MLSDRTIKALKKKNALVADGGGLYLRVSAHGTKTFLFRQKTAGKTRYQTLGEYPRLALVDARKKVSELQGVQIGDTTVQATVEAYIKSLDYLHPEQVKQRLEANIVPEVGATTRISKVTQAQLSAALQKIVDRGARVQANRTLADVRHLFEYSFQKGWITKDVSANITRKVVGGKEKSKKIVLTDAELKELIKDLRSDRWEPKTRAGIALVLLTGQRSSECLGCKDEVSGDWWTIPSHRTNKTDLPPQKVYLVPVARYLTRYAEPCDHRTLSKALLRAGKRYTPHSLRHTMRTKMGDLGVMPHVAEKCLHHKLEGVLAVYDHGEYLPEREAAWKLWYAYLRRLV